MFVPLEPGSDWRQAEEWAARGERREARGERREAGAPGPGGRIDRGQVGWRQSRSLLGLAFSGVL